MVRAFTPADVIQHTTGSPGFVTDPGVALPNPAVEGNSGVIMMQVNNMIDPPEQWHLVAQAGAVTTAPQSGVLCRACLSAGDQSWTFVTTGGGSTTWVWVAEEWANLSYAPLLSPATRTIGVAAPTSLTSGASDSWDAGEYALGIAVIGLTTVAGGAQTWPTVTWSGGFTETDTVTRGDGTVAGDIKMHVARRYGTAGETGPWTAGATLTGAWAGVSGKTGYCSLAVFRAGKYAGDI
jgi:hypothetical protein